MQHKTFRGAAPRLETDEARRRERALIGGSLDRRRAHGTASDLRGGRYALDPVFVAADEARLRAACAADPSRPLAIEIGFQMGEFAAAWCAANPGARYVGFEVRSAYVRAANALFERGGLTNGLAALVDARTMIPAVVESATLDWLFVFFPDPWWKPKHVRKRLISPDFVADAAGWLRPGGRWVVKTDVAAYADHAEALIAAHPAFAVRRLEDPHAGLPWTLRERRCAARGEPTWAIEATICSSP